MTNRFLTRRGRDAKGASKGGDRFISARLHPDDANMVRRIIRQVSDGSGKLMTEKQYVAYCILQQTQKIITSLEQQIAKDEEKRKEKQDDTIIAATATSSEAATTVDQSIGDGTGEQQPGQEE